MLVLEEPTRGVDIGTKREIYDLIRRMAADGTTVIWWSTEQSELIELCDSVLAFDADGRPTGVLKGDELNEERLRRRREWPRETRNPGQSVMRHTASPIRYDEVPAAGRPGRGVLGVLSSYRTEVAIAIAIILLEIVVGILVPSALTWGNIINIAQAAAPLVIMAFGVLLVVITGGIDLSVGSVFSLTGMVTALAMVSGVSSVVSTIIGLGVGLLFGAINGLLVTFAGLAPFVVTLITYAVAGSLSFIVTNGHSLPVPDMDYWLLNGGTMVPGVPNYVLYCLVLLVVIEFFLKKMVAGRWVYAIGSSSGAARLLGVPVRAIRFSVYVVSGLLAAFASILSISYISNAEGPPAPR